MITPKLLVVVKVYIGQAVEKLADAGRELDRAFLELAKRNEENSPLGRTIKWAVADIRRLITILDAFHHTWNVALHGNGGE